MTVTAHHTARSPAARTCGLPALRRERLLAELPATVDLLWRRRAAEVPEQDIDDYVTLRWLRWHSGALTLTDDGRTLHDLVVARGTTP